MLAGVTRTRGARARHCRPSAARSQPGFDADFAVWSVDTLDELGYWVGFNPCSMVVKGGEIVLERAV